MRACVLHAAEDLRLEERPVEPLGSGEVRVKIGAGGICGSDLHYYFEGRNGDFVVHEPLILGHEVAGDVVEVGPHVERVRVGDRVAVNPSTPCLTCRYCLEGREHLCRNMRFLGSASTFPHVQGGFQELFVARERNCFVVPNDMPLPVAACAEPLAVCLHAARRAGPLLGQEVLIAGCGPIGALLLLAARRAGARTVVVTDLVERPLRIASELGADEAVNAAGQGERMAEFERDRGRFDVAFEASGSPRALATCIAVTRPGGRVVQVGMLPPGEVAAPIMRMMAKELELVFSNRFEREFGWAVAELVGGRIDVEPILSGLFPFTEADAAFATAKDRTQALKVHLTPA